MDDVLRPVFEIFELELREQAPEVANALINSAEMHDPAERRELLSSVYRFAHSMKGNAGTLGLEDLQELAHAMEQLLVPYRDGSTPVQRDHAQAILRAVDLCPGRVALALGGAEGRDQTLDRTTSELLQLAAGGLLAPAPATQSAAAPVEVKPDAALTPNATSAPASSQRASAQPPSTQIASPAPAEMMRVSVERLGRLDRILDDLRDARGTLETRVDDVRRIFWLVEETLAELGASGAPQPLRAARDLLRELSRSLGLDVADMSARMTNADEELRHLRMLPAESVLTALPRAVWEHAQRVGKKASLKTRGTDVALDRRLLEELKDPLVHLVRNSVDHGIELPEARARAGKPEEGTLLVEVEQRGPRVLLSVSDDGAGVNVAAVRDTAVRRGLLTQEAASRLDDQAVHDLLFAPGFSTAAEVSMTSGRGVGLDVVREKLAKVGGRVTLTTTPGKGTRFELDLPLTLATAQALLVEAGAHLLALPLGSVHSAHYVPVRGGEPPSQLSVEGQPLSIDSLATLLNLPERDAQRTGFAVVVLRSGDRLVALRVERLLGEREVVLKPLPPELTRLRHLLSAASLGDGRVVFLLQPRALMESVTDAQRSGGRAGTHASRRRRVLVADDSITTRSMHRQVLEAAGFEVDTASDGEEALRLLSSSKAFDLVVSDVRMPRLDGVGLTEKIRAGLHAALPVVLVSSLDSDEDRSRATVAGASALLSKGAYERGELLKLVRSLLPS